MKSGGNTLLKKSQLVWTAVAAIWVSVGATAVFAQQNAQTHPAAAEAAQDSPRMQQIRHIILHSRHMGAHGLGYNDASLEEMSRKLRPGDVSDLLRLMQVRNGNSTQESAIEENRNIHLHVGAQFGLASQCGASLGPLRQAMINHQVMFLDAQDTARMAADFPRCSPADRAKATAMVSELENIYQADMLQRREEAAKKAAEDGRIQGNGLKMMDPAKAKTLTRAEREEAFARSVKAAGLDKEPLTDAQKKMVEQMYKTMVLGESGNRPAN